MKIPSLFHSLLLPAPLLLLCSCSEEAPGLQQKMVEMQARLAAKQAEVTDLQAKLAEARNAAAGKPAESAASPLASGDDSAAVGAAADELARSLAEGMKPGQLLTSPKVVYAGLTLRTANGSRGVAVPFFYNNAAGKWECGWSGEQVKAALQGADSPSSPAPVVSQSPVLQPAASSGAPSAASASSAAAPMRLPRGWTYDASTGQVTASDGTPMPPLKQGERYEMIVGGAGETPRPVVVSEDGSQRLIVR
jgi:hypothetical protein